MWFHLVFITFFNLKLNVADTLVFETSGVDPEANWNSTESLTLRAGEDESEAFMLPAFKSASPFSSHPPALKLPESVPIRASQLRADLFIPQRGAGPVPPEVRAILLPVNVPARVDPDEGVKKVEVLCHLDRMYVNVLKSLFADLNAWKNMKLGTCAVNKVTSTHYHFLYPLRGCGIRRGEDASRVVYANTLNFKPTITGLIIRDLPFTIPIRCTYYKFLRSYQVGYLPKKGRTFYRGLHPIAGPSLTAMDSSWNFLPVGESFMLGQPICFEAKGPKSGRRRLYLNTCFVTSSPKPTASNSYVVVENAGCLVDSKNAAEAKYYHTTDKTTVRLCFPAFFFRNMVFSTLTEKAMFMHCELYFGPEHPVPSSKSCTYNHETKMWTELNGETSVCDCCESTCPASPEASGRSMITSKWGFKLGQEPLAAAESMPDFSLAGHDDFELFWEIE